MSSPGRMGNMTILDRAPRGGPIRLSSDWFLIDSETSAVELRLVADYYSPQADREVGLEFWARVYPDNMEDRLPIYLRVAGPDAVMAVLNDPETAVRLIWDYWQEHIEPHLP